MIFRTPLHISIMADNQDLFNILIGNSLIEINLKSSPQEHTALYYALLKYESGDTTDDSYAMRLIKKGAQTDVIYSSTCDSLLQTLIREGANGAAAFIISHVKNINHANSQGETALHFACVFGADCLIGELLKNGALPNSLTVETRQTALHCAVKSNSLECIQAFIDCNDGDKVNFNIKDVNGDTPLSLALNEGCQKLVPTLIKGKADVNVKNGKEFTLLHQAILKEDSSTAIFLLDNGADMNAK